MKAWGLRVWKEALHILHVETIQETIKMAQEKHDEEVKAHLMVMTKRAIARRFMLNHKCVLNWAIRKWREVIANKLYYEYFPSRIN